MLPNEIEPFAAHHTQELEAVKALLKQIQNVYPDYPEVKINAALDQLTSAQHAIYRFKMCLADEQATKNRYEAKRYEERLQKMREERK